MNTIKFFKHGVFILLSVTLLCPSAQARVILGVSAGQSGLSDDLAKSIQAKNKQSTAILFTLGYQLTPPWSVNVRYGVLVNEPVKNGQNIKLTTGAILHRYDFLPTSRWDVYGMMGVSYNEQSVSGQITTGTALPAKKELQRVSPVGGLGVGYHVTPRQSIGVEAVAYTKDTWAAALEYRHRFPNKTIENDLDWKSFEQKFSRAPAQVSEKVAAAEAVASAVASEPEPIEALENVNVAEVSGSEGFDGKDVDEPKTVNQKPEGKPYESRVFMGAFTTDDSGLSEALKSSLNDFASKIKSDQRGIKSITVNGYTDASGPANKNVAISTQRAESVEVYLGDLFPNVPISSWGWGEANPVFDNLTAENRALNRRVEVIVNFK